MQVNGTAVASIPIFIKNKFGDAGYKKWVDTLASEGRKVYSGIIFPSSWYDLDEIMVLPTKKLCEMFYGNNERGAWESGRFSAEYGLKGVLKFFVQVASVNLLVKKASTIIASYYKPSVIEVVENDKGSGIVRISTFPDMNKMIELRIGGWMERAIEISGGKNVRVVITKSLTKGDECSEFRITWN